MHALLALLVLAPAADARDDLWAAVRSADATKAQAALDKGADVNAANEMGVSALWIAGGKGKLDVVELLLKKGADPNARDGIWYQTPLSQAAQGGYADLVTALLKAGAKDADDALVAAAGRGNLTVVEAVLANSKPKPAALSAALYRAPESNEKVRAALTKAGAVPLKSLADADRDALTKYAGTYVSDGGNSSTFAVKDIGLVAGGAPLARVGPHAFAPVGLEGTTYTFDPKGDAVNRLTMRRFTAEYAYYRAETKPVAKPKGDIIGEGNAKVTTPLNWPSFRGPDATGVADGQHPPVTFDVKANSNVRWKTPIPGLGHSCPVVWGDRVFLTTAVSGDPDPKVRIGNYGDVGSVDDKTKHTFRVLCLDRDTGKVIWDKVANEAVPKIKRHLKGSQANCTPATDGKRVVACFGPEGMYCYDFDGKLLWKRDLGTIDSSFALDREYEWGFGSSPIIHDGLVILQADLSRDSFLAAYSLEDGSRVWSTPRDEIPSWSSPAVWRTPNRTEIVTNAAQYARGYDPVTGKELWRLAKKSEVTIPAPVVGPDRVYITSGNRPIQPIIAVRPGATGDISLKTGEEKNDFVAWSRLRGGPYMPTPVLYRGHLYVLSNAGMLTAHDATTGAEVYKERIGGTSYTASPVAADGRLYLTSEQGEVRVVKAAGADSELLAVNKVDDIVLATPAISAGALFVRTQHHLITLGRPSK